MGTTVAIELSSRDRAILRAVAYGRVEVVSGTVLQVDGRCCADQSAATRLLRAGLVAPQTPGTRAPAVLTPAGSRATAG